MTGRVLLYGASGFTGQAIARNLAGRFDLMLAGRNPDLLGQLGAELGLPWRAFDLANPGTVAAGMRDCAVLLNAAGPYADTAMPLAQACLAKGIPYLDVGGEWPVFEALMELDGAAQAAGAMIMPGLGLTIAASDCLLKRAVEQWPDTVRMCLGVSRAHAMSRGSATTAARLFEKQVMVRRSGKLKGIPLGSLTRPFDFGEGLRETTAMSWADVVTGEHTTGVNEIEVYSELPWWQRAGWRASGVYASLTGGGPWRSAGAALARAWPQDPGEKVRQQGRYTMVVEALDRWRRPRWLRLHTGDGYSTTVLVAAEGLRRVLEGEVRAGFQTPAGLFGSGFIEQAGAGRFEAVRGSSAA
ncbi:MAG: saccharopine dehydrogenase family protein [Erythrobacter sp.]